jgi:tetratricopeptide (TPR) repeat protein
VPAENTPAFGAIAERFRRGGDLERAVALCQEGLAKFPDALSARVTLGWALLDLGRYDEAREALESALKRAPDNLAAIRGLAELHDRAEHTMLVPMGGPDAPAGEAFEVDPSASTTPADVLGKRRRAGERKQK